MSQQELLLDPKLDRIPPNNTEAAVDEEPKYSIEFWQYVGKEPHRFDAPTDEDAMKYVANYFNLEYPFTEFGFWAAGGDALRKGTTYLIEPLSLL